MEYITPLPSQCMPAGTGDAPVIQMAAIRPVLPIKLWPHNFIILSTIMAVILGLLNVFTLPLTVPAIIAGLVVCQKNPPTMYLWYYYLLVIVGTAPV